MRRGSFCLDAMSEKSKPSYAEKLKNPNWQKKRLEILERDRYKCRVCGSGLNDGKTLHVHHLFYRKGAMPWEYEDEALVTVCEDHHETMQELGNDLLKAASKYVGNISMLTDFATALNCTSDSLVFYGWVLEGVHDLIQAHHQFKGGEISKESAQSAVHRIRDSVAENLYRATIASIGVDSLD